MTGVQTCALPIYDETDEYAHEGKYDQYLIATNLLDEYIAELWNWTQKNYHYKNKTTILITTDHGRGHETIDAWRNHVSLVRSEEHTSELQSRTNLVCRLLLEKKKKKNKILLKVVLA